MRVIHVAETLYGGVGTYINELIRCQFGAYDKVVVVCPEDQVRVIENDAVTIVPFRRTGRDPASIYRLYRAIVSATRTSDYDIMHLHSSFAGLAARLRFGRRKEKIIYCPHGWPHAMTVSRAKRRAYILVEKLLAFNTDAIVNISKSEARLSEQVAPRSKCVTIYNGMHDEPWSPLPEGKPLGDLLFVGRYDFQKGIDILFEAMETLGPHGLRMKTVGGGVLDQSAGRPRPDSAVDLGWRKPEEIVALMSAADAVVMPSRWEGFSLVALEAMRAGRPLVATRVSSLPEQVIDGETGVLCAPESAAVLVEAVERLGSLDIRAIGINARTRYEALFSADRMFEQLDALYRSLVRDGRLPS